MAPRSSLPGFLGLLVFTLAGSSAGLACGGGVTGTGGSGDSADSGAGTSPSSSPSSAPPASDAGRGPAADAGFLLGGEGFVNFGVTDDSAPPTVTAAFYEEAFMPDYVNRGIDQRCDTVSPYGSCTLYICSSVGTPSVPLPATISAGTVTVNGADGSFALDPVADSSGATYVLAGAASLAPAEMVSITAPGGTFTSFAARLAIAPRIDLSAGLPAAVGMTADATLTWAPAAATSTSLVVTFQQLAPDEPTLVCTYPAGAGTGTIPSDAWTYFMPGSVTVTAAAVTTASLGEGTATAALYLSSSTSAFVTASSALDVTLPVN